MTDIHHHDIIVFGAGLTGLWIAGRLKRAGYDVMLVEKEKTGGQLLLCDGVLDLKDAALSDRWESCFGGYGDIDLTAVPDIAQSALVWAHEKSIPKNMQKEMRKLDKKAYPEFVNKSVAFFEQQQRVIDMQAFVAALSKPLQGSIFKSEMENVLPDGQVALSDRALQGRLLIFALGAENEKVLSLLKVGNTYAPVKQTRHVTLRYMDDPFFGSGRDENGQAVLTITSHAEKEGYVWHMRGALVDALRDQDDAAVTASLIPYLSRLFDIDWKSKFWQIGDAATTANDEPLLHQRGRILLAWPGDLPTLPLLADRVMAWLKGKDISPAAFKSPPPHLPLIDN